MIKRYFQVDVGETVFLVFSDKKHRNQTKNIVLRARVDSIVINENGTTYTARGEKVVLSDDSGMKDIKKYVPFWSFKDDNVDTGYHTVKYIYPVFTTKEKCMAYLRGETI